LQKYNKCKFKITNLFDFDEDGPTALEFLDQLRRIEVEFVLYYSKKSKQVGALLPGERLKLKHMYLNVIIAFKFSLKSHYMQIAFFSK